MKPHPLADVIACSTMDARDPVPLPPPKVEAWLDDDVVVVTPRCTVCRVREAKGDFAFASPNYLTCGEPFCVRQAAVRRKAENPKGGDGVSSLKTKYVPKRRA